MDTWRPRMLLGILKPAAAHWMVSMDILPQTTSLLKGQQPVKVDLFKLFICMQLPICLLNVFCLTLLPSS